MGGRREVGGNPSRVSWLLRRSPSLRGNKLIFITMFLRPWLRGVVQVTTIYSMDHFTVMFVLALLTMEIKD